MEKEIIKSSKNNHYVFCYGTLKKYNRNHYMMKGAKYIGNGRLHNVTMVDLGRYPGLISGRDSVVGEIYCVDDKKKEELDIFEEVGTLYTDKEAIIEVNHTLYQVHYYEMIPDGNNYPICLDKDNYYRVDPNNFVWYVCYGSNILEERFIKYINRTTLKEKWLKSEEITIPYNMYYGNSFAKWNYGGCAFLDTSKNGLALGKGYLIHKEQFHEIWQMEGPFYDLKVDLGKNYDGVTMLTFTNSNKLKENTPTKDYVEVIAMGMCRLKNCDVKEIKNFLHYDKNDLDLSKEHIEEILKSK